MPKAVMIAAAKFAQRRGTGSGAADRVGLGVGRGTGQVGGTVRSLTQLPWKPNGTRWGSGTWAT